jgi:hypothetical protein
LARTHNSRRKQPPVFAQPVRRKRKDADKHVKHEPIEQKAARAKARRQDHTREQADLPLHPLGIASDQRSYDVQTALHPALHGRNLRSHSRLLGELSLHLGLVRLGQLGRGSALLRERCADLGLPFLRRIVAPILVFGLLLDGEDWSATSRETHRQRRSDQPA